MGGLMQMSRFGLVILAIMFGSVSGAAWAQTALTMEKNEAELTSQLIYRTSLGRADDVRLLLKMKLNPSLTNKEGVPLLSLAAARKDNEALNVVKALVEGGADVNGKNTRGQTALFFAAKNGNAPVVKYLMEQKINYYALDKNGDIARTYAHRAGHKEVVDLMDDFVKAQTSAALEEHSTPERNLEVQLSDDANEEKIVVEDSPKSLPAKKPEKPPVDVKKLVYDAAYNACAFQYWSYCRATEQTTDFSENLLRDTIAMHKENYSVASRGLMEELKVDQAYIKKISDPSMQAVYNQINAMPSRTYRRQQGVGTFKDMEKRCSLVADTLQIALPAAKKK